MEKFLKCIHLKCLKMDTECFEKHYYHGSLYNSFQGFSRSILNSQGEEDIFQGIKDQFKGACIQWYFKGFRVQGGHPELFQEMKQTE